MLFIITYEDTSHAAGVNNSSSGSIVAAPSPAPPPVKQLTVSSKEFDPLQQAELQVRQLLSYFLKFGSFMLSLFFKYFISSCIITISNI